jgi:RNA polymerase-binding transcription factor DksA
VIDEGELAADLAEMERAAAIAARVIEAVRPGGPPTHCAECEGEIEAGRRKTLPYTGRCAACAHDAAERLRLGGLT